jgi:ubiquinone/menaquinone biosynthesis C-methylase UbiE
MDEAMFLDNSDHKDKLIEIYDLLDNFLDLCDQRISKDPYLIVILMHEYFRNIWPNDPFIKPVLSSDKLENTKLCLKNCIDCLEKTEFLGSYFNSKDDLFKKYKTLKEDNESEKHITQTVYGKLWKSLESNYILDESKQVLTDLFEKNGKNIDDLKGKKVLDMGCGSGRFTLGFAQLGVEKITGIDLGKTGISVGRKLSEKFGLKNIEFIEQSVLSLPFDDESFDFVFSKGVLHHTGNLEKSLDEYHRVLKKGGQGFLYLYGSGGLFWNSRTKMRDVMQKIPMNYTNIVLETLGMPSKRYIFADSWYVPVEEHVTRERLVNYLKIKNYSKIKQVEYTGSDDILSMSNLPYSKELWGDGELRYFLTK